MKADLDFVLDKAVDCRNHYVHGSEIRFDGQAVAPLLTDALEFVFGASDLLDAGWDIEGWGRTARP